MLDSYPFLTIESDREKHLDIKGRGHFVLCHLPKGVKSSTLQKGMRVIIDNVPHEVRGWEFYPKSWSSEQCEPVAIIVNECNCAGTNQTA